MNVRLEWLIENRVMLLTLQGDICEDDFVGMGDQLAAMMDAGDAPIHLIADSSRQSKPLLDIHATRSIFSVLRSDKFGWAIHIGGTNNRAVGMISSVISQMLGIRYRPFDTIEDAIAFIEDQDPSLEKETLAVLMKT